MLQLRLLRYIQSRGCEVFYCVDGARERVSSFCARGELGNDEGIPSSQPGRSYEEACRNYTLTPSNETMSKMGSILFKLGRYLQ